MATILVAMSGGVDSSVTAALLREQGHHVEGATMILRGTGPDQDIVAAARSVCARLGVPHHVFDYHREFRHHVINTFIKDYAHGSTPNPCLTCNRTIKFHRLLEQGLAMGFERVATGHYARIEQQQPADPLAPPVWNLLRGIDTARDQSYVLYMLQQHELDRVSLPLGTMTKQEVREQARQRELETANRPESQDICFIPDNDYRRFLREEMPTAFVPGPILDQEGHEIGTHQGLPRYTVGQRKGLGLTSPEPLFVTDIDAARNALIVGPASAAARPTCLIDEVTFTSGRWPEGPLRCLVQIRAHALPAAATAIPLPDQQQVEIQFVTPQRAVTPGQAAVLYEGNRVVGGGRIIASPPRKGVV